MDRWRLQRQGKKWFLGIIIAYFPEILSRSIGYLGFIFQGSLVIKNKKLSLRIIGYLEIIFPGIQVDKCCMQTSKKGYVEEHARDIQIKCYCSHIRENSWWKKYSRHKLEANAVLDPTADDLSFSVHWLSAHYVHLSAPTLGLPI